MSSIGAAVSNFFGSENKGNQGKYAMAAPGVDTNAYQYGGHPGGADEAANRYANQAAQAQGRQGEQINTGNSDYDRMAGQYSRLGQNDAAAMMLARASGQTPSISQMQADRQMGQATAAQTAQAASARGAGGMALAQQNAANNTANAQGQISGQAQINAANERLQAEQAASGAYTAMRGGDLASQGQDAGQATAQAQLNAAQRAQNDTVTQGMTQNEMGVRNSALTAGMNGQAQQSSNALGAGQINAGVSGQNASMNQSNAMGLMGLGSSVAGWATGGGTPPPKAAGGPVAGRQPYLVGEQGPELIVPKHDGTVIPAGPTAALLGRGVPRAVGGPVKAGGAPMTWGAQPAQAPLYNPRVEQQRAADAAADTFLTAQHAYQQDPALAQRIQTPAGNNPMLAVAGFTPGIPMAKDEPLRRRDAETVSLANAKEAQGAEMSDRDRYEAKGAEYREGQTKSNDRKASKAEAQKLTPASIFTQLGESAQKQGAAIDTGYHGGGGQLGVPHLLALPGRAMGGPVQAGGEPGAVDIGSGGSGISSSMVKEAAAGSRGPLNTVGGGGLVGGTNVPGGTSGFGGGALSGIGGGLQKLASSIDTGYHGFPARAEGGDVQAGGADVLPLYEPPGKQLHQSDEGHAYYADAPVQSQSRELIASRPASPAEVVMSMTGAKAAPPPMPAQRQMTPDEMKRAADEMMKQLGGEYAARMAAGPAVRRQ